MEYIPYRILALKFCGLTDRPTDRLIHSIHSFRVIDLFDCSIDRSLVLFLWGLRHSGALHCTKPFVYCILVFSCRSCFALFFANTDSIFLGRFIHTTKRASVSMRCCSSVLSIVPCRIVFPCRIAERHEDFPWPGRVSTSTRSDYWYRSSCCCSCGCCSCCCVRCSFCSFRRRRRGPPRGQNRRRRTCRRTSRKSRLRCRSSSRRRRRRRRQHKKS
mmetsp:Transcript_5304/g.12024  ORF Transcript_5304/g.12024 Transcript_5304/m.12024 type:complete len:216 (-) Transcript_5304:196-843(-)